MDEDVAGGRSLSDDERLRKEEITRELVLLKKVSWWNSSKRKSELKAEVELFGGEREKRTLHFSIGWLIRIKKQHCGFLKC